MPEVRLIDANALLNDLKESAKDAREWREGTQDEEIKIRAEQAHGTFVECALRVKNAPTIEAEPVRHGRWIPCSERLPEKTGYYLVFDSTAEFDNIRGRQDVSKYVIGRHGGHWYGAIRREYITHWMQLPEPPEKE